MACRGLMKRRRYSTWVLLCSIGMVFLYYRKTVSDLTKRKQLSEEVMHMRQLRYLEYKLSERRRMGPGEKGQPGPRLTAREEKLAGMLFEKEGFNRLISDKIALDRALVDNRPRE